jgi:regulatory protein
VIVTRLERLRRKRNRYALYLDGSRACEISEAIAFQFRLGVGDALSPGELERLNRAEADASARDIALNFLSYRPRSSREILDHLRRKGIPPESAQAVIDRFTELRLVNDLEFARMFVRDRMSRKRTGTSLLRQQLSTKGIPGELVDQVLGEIVTDEGMAEAALLLVRKRLERSASACARLEPAQRRQRMLEYLLRRGFPFEIAQRAVRTAVAER